MATYRHGETINPPEETNPQFVISATSPNMPTVTKRDLVVKISDKLGRTQQDVLEVLQEFLDHSTEELASGNPVVLRNFGTFELKQTKPRKGRNPTQPEKEVLIPARAIVKFKPGKELKEKVAQVLPLLQANENQK